MRIAALTLLVGVAAGSAQAQTLIEEWNTAQFPPPPALKPATLVPAETALLARGDASLGAPPQSAVLVSNRGGVLAGAGRGGDRARRRRSGSNLNAIAR